MAPDIRIRSFRWQDLEPFTRLFNAVNGISHTLKAYDVESMRQILSQPSCDPLGDCYLAEAGDSLVGYTIISPELRIRRAVAAGGVLEEHRRHGIGRRLVKTAIEHVSKLDASVLHIETPADGADIFGILKAEGFRQVRCYWAMRREDPELPAVAPPAGFTIRSFRLGKDEAALTELQNAAFGQNWGFCPNTVKEVAARVRFNRCDPDGIILVADASRLSAYNWTMRAANETESVGWVAMTGVHPDYRRKGLGRLVVVEGMRYLTALGVDGVELQVDSDNTAARELYQHLGFRRTAETLWYERSLKS